MNIQNIHRIYFIGIGGIGMSALARYMLFMKKEIAGYDATPSPVTQALSDKGVYIQFDDNLDLVPDAFKEKETLIVYTPAIRKEDNTLLQHFAHAENILVKRAKLLGEVTRDSICLAVAGTHGKTTTSAMLTHILYEAGLPMTAFLGGISENYQSNLIYTGKTYTVVEADEYDYSFLQLHPDYTCITSTDADHLDIYKTGENLQKVFSEFAQLTQRQLFVKKGVQISGLKYAIDEPADYRAYNIRVEDEKFIFDVQTPHAGIKDFAISLPGSYNVLNALGAISMAEAVGVSLQKCKKAMTGFKGIERRFSYRIHNEKYVLIDDYAHHPTEIRAFYRALNALYPGSRKLVVFQPHLYSRTRNFEKDFVAILSLFDQVCILPIYPAREKPVPGVNAARLVEKIKEFNPNVSLIAPAAITKIIQASGIRIIAMLGAGSIGQMVKEVTRNLQTES